MPARQAHPTVVIIGAGRVATAFGVSLSRSGFRVVSVISRRPSSARRLAALVRCSSFSSRLAQVPGCPDLILLAVPDDVIASVARQLADRTDIDLSSTCVLHASGSRTSDELRPLRRRGAATGSLHPIQSFPSRQSPRALAASLTGISYGFEGDPRAARMASRIVRRLHGRFTRVPKEGKKLYHIACVIASNYAVTLIGMASQVLRQSGRGVTVKDLAPLVQTSVAAAIGLGAERALTGPIARGDVETVRQHLTELKKRDRRLVAAYRALGNAALELALRGRRIPPEKRRELRSLLGRSR